ncbi:protein FAM136A-like [Rhopalosiphum maidis]|uniref:protein FAM136A-like n=1 Tax=Rhopalosiphum maidis TaxID=43146 RepID=UPI000F00E9BE|nr:protein FAM136A-like [Rhopalosiphum maidis]
MEEEQRRMQSAVYDVLNDIDRKCLRTLQIQMHQCAIECCKDPSKNIESLEVCNENCSKEVAAARNYVQNEFSKWQNRIQRCVQDCSDTIMDKMPSDRNRSENEMNKYIKEAEGCTSQCFTKYIKILPQLTNKIVDNLSNKKLQ